MPDTALMAVAFELFGPTSTSAGQSHVGVEIPSGGTVQAAIDVLIDAHPQVRAAMQAAVIAADGVMVKRDTVLAGGEQLTVVTLVSGG